MDTLKVFFVQKEILASSQKSLNWTTAGSKRALGVSETEESGSSSSSKLTSPTDLRYFAICCLFTIVIVVICVSFLKQASVLREAHNELVVVDVVVVGDGHDICSTPPS